MGEAGTSLEAPDSTGMGMPDAVQAPRLAFGTWPLPGRTLVLPSLSTSTAINRTDECNDTSVPRARTLNFPG